jgi:hypothetical protein
MVARGLVQIVAHGFPIASAPDAILKILRGSAALAGRGAGLKL